MTRPKTPLFEASTIAEYDALPIKTPGISKALAPEDRIVNPLAAVSRPSTTIPMTPGMMMPNALEFVEVELPRPRSIQKITPYEASITVLLNKPRRAIDHGVRRVLRIPKSEPSVIDAMTKRTMPYLPKAFTKNDVATTKRRLLYLYALWKVLWWSTMAALAAKGVQSMKKE